MILGNWKDLAEERNSVHNGEDERVGLASITKENLAKSIPCMKQKKKKRPC